jgi:sterol 24-C-methyltransferase
MKMFLQESIPSGEVRETVEAYRASHGKMVNAYYDLVTDFYEYGWADSFHFAPRYRGESFKGSLARHQHFVAHRLCLGPADEVLDAGCGVGGPARSIARFSGARVFGLNNNAYQVARARALTARARLQHRCRFEVGDFMNLDLAPGRFDAAYAIESTAHASDKAACFAEIHRVLAPGASFVGYEWCLTDLYDADRPRHRDIKAGIEEGNGLTDLATISVVARALERAGFDLVELDDRAAASDVETPWYLPLTGRGIGPRELLMKPLGRAFTHHAVGLLERLGVAPRGTQEVTGILNRAADWLVAGGETGVFTPMLFFHAVRR